MAYKALYRTYRPSTFSEVAGQQHIVRTLQNALKTNKLAHAYLFCGPRGTGKTTMAKLLAKSLNCEEGLGHQCNHCSNCLSINEGSHPDVIEIDAASNNGVEEVRDLIDKVKYSPIKGKYKVYIIDEVHMMTTSAFNALLKTLEEPPEYVVFVLATTEAHKIIPTIISRCQKYDFAKVGDLDIKSRMVEILDKESISFEDKALELIVSLADGGMRDALSILDQTIAYSGKAVKEEDIEELFGIAGNDEKLSLLKAIAAGDTKSVLGKLDYFATKGVDIKRLNNDLLDILKDLVIYKKIKDPELLLKMKPAELVDISNILPIRKAVSLIDILLDAQVSFRHVANIRSLFEITLLKMVSLEDKPEATPLRETGIEEKKTPPDETSSSSRKTELTNKPDKKEETSELPPWMRPKLEPAKEVKSEKKPPEPAEARKKVETSEPPSFIGALDIKVSPLAMEGEHNLLAEEIILNMMVTGLKEEKLSLINKWGQLKELLMEPEAGKYASLLLDGIPYILCKEGMAPSISSILARSTASFPAR